MQYFVLVIIAHNGHTIRKIGRIIECPRIFISLFVNIAASSVLELYPGLPLAVVTGFYYLRFQNCHQTAVFIDYFQIIILHSYGDIIKKIANRTKEPITQETLLRKGIELPKPVFI